MSITSILTIDGVSYNASQRAGALVLPTGLDRTLDGGYDTFTFWEAPREPAPSWKDGKTVVVASDIGDGNGSVVRFSGVIVDVQTEHGALGWGHAYTCEGLKSLGDLIPVTAVDQTGQQVYNRSRLDEYYTPSDSGLELGEIIRRILCIPATAQALNAIGIGSFTGLPSAPVLPAATLADLALMTIVPRRPVVFSGEGIFNAIDNEISQWQPRFFSDVEPTGLIRFRDTTSSSYFAPQTFTCPSADGAGDPVTTPRVQRSTKNCATRLILRGGPQVEVAILSLVDGTLAEVFTSGDKSAWNLTYFTAPKGATDYGVVTAVTSTSATLQSNNALTTWPTNFWGDSNANLTLIDSVASGISQFETRNAIANDALTAGGTSTVDWDTTWPITGTAYDMYRISGGAGGLNDTWRTYTPREPLTGNTGLDTYVGSHLVTRSAHAVKVANAQQSFDAFYTTAMIKGGSLGQEMPLGIQAVPSEGMFRFTQPTVTVFGNPSTLNSGSPTTTANGKPIDVVVYALYSRGAMSVVVPPDIAGVPQYEGTAFVEDELERTKTLDFPQWLWVNDTGSFADLAQEFLDTIKNSEVDVSICWYLTPGGPVPGFDFLSFGYALNIDIAGQTSPWSNINAPVRSIGIKWDWTGQGSQALTFHASTRKRAFAGFDLYIHPEFAQGSPLSNAFTEQSVGRGNYEAYDQVRKSGGLPGPNSTAAADPGSLVAGASKTPDTGSIGGLAANPGSLLGISSQVAGTGNQTSLGSSGFTMDDIAAAGQRGPNAQRGPEVQAPSVRSPEAQARYAASHQSPLERRAREAGERAADKEAKTKKFYADQDAKEARQDSARQAREAAKVARRDKDKPTSMPLDRNKGVRDGMIGDLVNPLTKDLAGATDRTELTGRNQTKAADGLMNSAVRAANQPLAETRSEAMRPANQKRSRQAENQHNLERLETKKGIAQRQEEAQGRREQAKGKNLNRSIGDWNTQVDASMGLDSTGDDIPA